MLRSSTKKAQNEQKRLRAARHALRSSKSSTQKKKQKKDTFDVDSFLKDVEVEEAENGVSVFDKNGKSVGYTKQQVKLERRFREDLIKNYRK